MLWCCWCADATDALMLLMRWSCWCCSCSWCTDAADGLMLLMRWCCWCADAADSLMLLLMRWSCCRPDAADVLMLLMHWGLTHYQMLIMKCIKTQFWGQFLTGWNILIEWYISLYNRISLIYYSYSFQSSLRHKRSCATWRSIERRKELAHWWGG